MRLRILVPVLGLLAGIAAPALAKNKPFSGSEMLTGRGMKPPAQTQTVQVGIQAGVSPISAALGYVKDELRDRAVAECEESGLAGCGPNVDAALEALKNVPDSTWDRMESVAGMTDPEIDKALVDAGVTDPYARQQVKDYVAKSGLTPQERQDAVKAVRIAAKAESSVNLLLEPYVRVNTKYVEAGASLPFMLRIRNAGTDAHLGNVTLDVRSGWVWKAGGMALGVTGGLGAYLPSGTRQADESGRADLFQAPKTMHQYLGLAPYLVVGFDASQWVLVQSHLEYLALVGVRDGPPADRVQVLKYGIGTVVLPSFFLNILAELNGMFPLENAAAFDVLYFTGGLQVKIAFFRWALAVEAPIWTAQRPDTTVIGGVPVGKLSKYNILTRLAFTF